MQKFASASFKNAVGILGIVGLDSQRDKATCPADGPDRM